MNMEELDEKKNQVLSKMIINGLASGINLDYFTKLFEISNNLDYKILDFCGYVKKEEDISIINSYLEQGIKLIDDIIERSKK